MSGLDGFELIETVSGIPSVSLTKHGISFNKATLEKLRCPNYVLCFINKSTREIAIVPCDKNDKGSRQFYRDGKDPANGARWNNYDLRVIVETMMGWKLETQGWKAAGRYSERDNALIYDLNKSEQIPKR